MKLRCSMGDGCWRSIEVEDDADHEIWNRRAVGTSFGASASLSPVDDGDGGFHDELGELTEF